MAILPPYGSTDPQHAQPLQAAAAPASHPTTGNGAIAAPTPESASAHPEQAFDIKSLWKESAAANGGTPDLGAMATVIEESRAHDKAQLILNRPTLRQEGMRGLVGHIAFTAAQYTEAVPTTVAQQVLGRFATTIGRTAFVQIGDETRHLRINAIICGPTSTGRKGTSTALPKRIFDHMHAHFLREWIPVQELTALSTGEGLIHQVRDPHTTPARGKLPAVIDNGAPDKRLFCDISEFAGVYAVSKRETATISTVLRDAFDGRVLTTPSKTSFNRATGTHICVFGSITAEEMSLMLSDNDKTNGLANRFPVFYSARTKLVPVPPPTNPKAVAWFAEQMAAVIIFASTVQQVTLSGEASVAWHCAYIERANESLPESVRKLLERRDVYGLTYAALFALLDKKSVIELVHIQAAFAWLDYWRDTVLFLFSSGAEIERAAKQKKVANHIVSTLVELGGIDVSYAAMKDKLTNKGKSTSMTNKVIAEALDLLMKEAPARVSVRTVRTTGRPAALYSVLPVQN